ncbi:MAG: alanyl-tRNA editing protein [Bryobacterales bacterium]|nr:alanyl-tRNA editing protein [Bryobacterales bacterium]
MPTGRLYYDDCYLRDFSATVIAVDEDGGIELDRSAFYPESGGQAHDLGSLNGHPVQRVLEREDRVLHYAQFSVSPGDVVHGEIDWERRFDLMQHHSGQHLLSAVAEELFGWSTEGVHMSAENATVELAVAQIDSASLSALEEECNRRIQSNFPVSIAIHSSAQGLPLRKATGREGPVRVVTIEGLDRSACGGTHVRATGEIGCLFFGRTERIRKNTRVEFHCGMRAVRMARARSHSVNQLAALFQTGAEQVPALAAAQREELAKLAKQFRALTVKEAKRDGGEARSVLGLRVESPLCVVRRVPEAIGDEDRAFAQGFCDVAAELPNRSVLLTIATASGAFLLSASADSRFDAKGWLAGIGPTLGAKGGGTEAMVSGRLASAEQVPALIAALPSAAVELHREAG